MMGNELLKIADGFSMVADGIRGLANMERNGAVDMAEKDAGVPGSAVVLCQKKVQVKRELHLNILNEAVNFSVSMEEESFR